MRLGTVVSIYARLTVIVGYDDIRIAVIVEVAESRAPAYVLYRERAGFFIAALTIVQPQLIALP